MLRISQYMKAVLSDGEVGRRPTQAPLLATAALDENLKPARKDIGPVVIWNLIRRCNLTCKHCYALSADTHFPGELATDEIYKVMDNLKEFNVPVLILSGGEPLLHPDIFDISKRAKDMGFYVGLSSNGTLITKDNIKQIADMNYDYVGVSLDGLGAVHDKFRRKDGAFEEAMTGIRLCKNEGIKVGIRFTMAQENAQDLPGLLDLMDKEDIDKFYFSHLNYAGRGNHNRQDDVFLETTRWAMDMLFTRCLDDLRAGKERDYVSGNNDADGVYLKLWIERFYPEKAAKVEAMLNRWGGNASGINVSNIDNLGDVHPDTMWGQHKLGNVKERDFSDIWKDVSDPLMAGLKQRPRTLKGRCGECASFGICGGNTRTRAYQLTGDPWQEDPACYLSNEEIGIAPSSDDTNSRLVTFPFSQGKRYGQVEDKNETEAAE